MKSSTSRRILVKALALGAAGGLLSARVLHAAAPQRLDVKDPAAEALGYVEDAGQVDSRKYPAFTKGSSCGNCVLLGGTAGSRFRPCSAFGGKQVSINGWCSRWTPEI